MIRSITAIIRGRKTTVFLMVVALILGVYNYAVMPRQETPDITAPYARITAVWPGASPEEMTSRITEKLEDMVAELPGFTSVLSYSRNSAAIVVVKLEADADYEKAWDALRTKADTLTKELPDQMQPLDINTNLTDTAGIIIAMSGEGYSYDELSDLAEELGRELGRVDGVARFEITGRQERVIRVRMDTGKLNRLGLSLADVAQVIGARNAILPLGSLNNGEEVIGVSPVGDLESLEDLKNLILTVSPENGSMLRLKDVAQVYEDYADENVRVKQNGRNAVLLTGYFKSDENVVAIGREVSAVVDAYRRELPSSLYFDEVLYQPDTVQQAVNSFIINLLEALVLIIITVFLGMGVRNALITSLSIPLSIALTFSAMAMLNIQIHQISIAGLIIALGMLVDNAVVVNDAIQVRIDSGEARLDACRNGVKEVYVPVLTSTLTTVGAYFPLLLLGGVAGDYVRSIPAVVIISLSASYIAAVFGLPVFAYLFLKPTRERPHAHRIREIFVRLLRQAFRRRGVTLLMAVLVFFGALGLATTLGLRFFPMADTDMIYLNVTADNAIHLDETEAVIQDIEEILSQQPEVVGYTSAIGDGLPRFYATLAPANAAKDYAQVMVKLNLDKGDRFKTNTWFVSHLQQAFDAGIPNARVTVKELEQGDPTGAPITVKLTGDNMETLAGATARVRAALADMPGTVNVEDNLSADILEFELAIDAVRATMRGLTLYEVQQEAGIALRGAQASVFKDEDREVPVLVESDIETREQLENLAIRSSATGSKVLLKDIADIHLTTSTPVIKRDERELSVSITSDVLPGYSAVELQNRLAEELEATDLGEVGVSYLGEREKILEYFGDMGILSIFALLIIFAILLVQFNSFRQPFIIFATIPLSLIGSIIGLKIFGQPLSFTAMLGMVSLLGMVVNNAIVLIDFINAELREGIHIQEACLIAVDKRFRPILLTTVTTVIGLIPLVVTGGELFQPLAIALMFGLMVSMLLTLIIIPVTFSVLENKREPRDLPVDSRQD
jgi:multidrug efflux pump subunit AcrB